MERWAYPYMFMQLPQERNSLRGNNENNSAAALCCLELLHDQPYARESRLRRERTCYLSLAANIAEENCQGHTNEGGRQRMAQRLLAGVQRNKNHRVCV